LAYQDYPRPQDEYYDLRHEYVTQGDIYRDVPWSQLGPTIVLVDPPPEWRPIPDGQAPALAFVSISPLAMVLSHTCDFRLPSAQDIDEHPENYSEPNSVYRSGFIRVAPILALDEALRTKATTTVKGEIRIYDHYQRLMYLPPLEIEGRLLIPESAVVLNMGDLLHLDLLKTDQRVAQLTYAARQQLARKLVLLDTGHDTLSDEYDPDLS